MAGARLSGFITYQENCCREPAGGCPSPKLKVHHSRKTTVMRCRIDEGSFSLGSRCVWLTFPEENTGPGERVHVSTLFTMGI